MCVPWAWSFGPNHWSSLGCYHYYSSKVFITARYRLKLSRLIAILKLVYTESVEAWVLNMRSNLCLNNLAIMTIVCGHHRGFLGYVLVRLNWKIFLMCSAADVMMLGICCRIRIWYVFFLQIIEHFLKPFQMTGVGIGKLSYLSSHDLSKPAQHLSSNSFGVFYVSCKTSQLSAGFSLIWNVS